jgi:predicted small lipoprotein YifL
VFVTLDARNTRSDQAVRVEYRDYNVPPALVSLSGQQFGHDVANSMGPTELQPGASSSYLMTFNAPDVGKQFRIELLPSGQPERDLHQHRTTSDQVKRMTRNLGRSKLARIVTAGTVLVLGLGLTACGSKQGLETPSSQKTPAGQNNTSTASLQKPEQPRTTVKLLWSHVGSSFGDPQITYVVRIENPADSSASVALNANALDASGTIVGSDQPTMPNVPARNHFDYFGQLGGTAVSQLTGKPVKVQVSQAEHPFGRSGGVSAPLLQTSQLKLTTGDREDLITDDPYSYNLLVRVTNTTGEQLTGGSVVQQVILYDTAGNIVGGGTGGSDNMPQVLPAGMSYREQWTGIPAIRKAASATYHVWVG